MARETGKETSESPRAPSPQRMGGPAPRSARSRRYLSPCLAPAPGPAAGEVDEGAGEKFDSATYAEKQVLPGAASRSREPPGEFEAAGAEAPKEQRPAPEAEQAAGEAVAERKGEEATESKRPLRGVLSCNNCGTCIACLDGKRGEVESGDGEVPGGDEEEGDRETIPLLKMASWRELRRRDNWRGGKFSRPVSDPFAPTRIQSGQGQQHRTCQGHMRGHAQCSREAHKVSGEDGGKPGGGGGPTEESDKIVQPSPISFRDVTLYSKE